MPTTHITFNPATSGGSRIRQLLSNIENGQSLILQELATFNTLIDGDGSSAAMFTAAASYYGFSDNANAKASWDELNSLSGKLNTDASVTSVMSAIKQAANKHR
jgi:hypothetical protein